MAKRKSLGNTVSRKRKPFAAAAATLKEILDDLLLNSELLEDADVRLKGRTTDGWLSGEHRPSTTKQIILYDALRSRASRQRVANIEEKIAALRRNWRHPSMQLSGSGTDDAPSTDKPQYRSLQERLISWGVNVCEELRQESVLSKLNAKLVIEDVLLDFDFAGFRGITESQVHVEHSILGSPRLPDYVYELRERMPAPEPNNPKAYLESCTGTIKDKRDVVSLRVGYRDSRVTSNQYDYWTTVAVRKAMPRIHEDLLGGNLQLTDLPRRLDNVLVVVTRDSQLLLAKRSNEVDSGAGMWMTSIGESVDPRVDKDHGTPSPIKAARRCLGEHDELNLAPHQVANARIRCLGIATEWQLMFANLVILVQLGIDFREVKDRLSRGEHTHLDGLDFTLDSCLPLVQEGYYAGRHKNRGAKLEPLSRLALLMSLMSEFGYDNVDRHIG